MSDSTQDEVLERAVAALERGRAGLADFERLRAEHPDHAASLDEVAELYAKLGDGATFEAPPCPPNYELRERIGAGGIGLVYRAFDSRLGRDVALKFLRPEFRGHATSIARFEREARVSGRLQHPAVVPVYELVTDDAHGPCLAMKLIEGRSLAELLADRPDCGDRLAEFVEIFAGVCQAIAYAHRHGVVHRDLKPHNVMVGAFGEVQVVDWGFAKLLGVGGPDREFDVSGPDSAAAPVLSDADSELLRSRVGSAFGSPPYMPPEQAKGEVDVMDERVDVFALGGILCEILTGRPPYTVDERPDSDVLDRARDADVQPALARLARPGVDAGLAAIAGRCLAIGPSERPRNASVVADLVAEHSRAAADRARNAELTAATERGRAERERQARRLTTALAIAGLLLTVGSVAFFAWRAEQQAIREERLDRLAGAEFSALDAALGRAKSAISLGSDARAREWIDDGLAHVEQIGFLVDAEGLDATSGVGRQAAARLDAFERERAATLELLDQRARERELLRLLRAARVPSHERADFETGAQSSLQLRIDRLSREAFDAVGVDLLDGDDASRFVAGLLDESRTPIAVALDVWAAARFGTGQGGWMRLVELADRLDASPVRSAFRRLVGGEEFDRDTWRDLRDSVPLAEHDSETAVVSVAWLLALGSPDEALPLLDVLRVRHPSDFDLVVARALCLEWSRPGRYEDAIAEYRVAKAIRPEVLEVRHRLGFSLGWVGQKADALAEWRELARLDPGDGHWHYHIGMACVELGVPEEALRAFDTAVTRSPGDPYSWTNLGIQLRDAGQIEAAEDALRRAIELKPDLPDPHFWLGKILTSTDPEAGQLEIERALGLFEAAGRPSLMGSLALAQIHRAGGRAADAVRVARSATEIAPDSSAAYLELAQSLLAQGARDDAAEAALQAAAIYRNAGRADFRTAVTLASVLRVAGRLEAAVELAECAVRDRPAHYGAYIELALAQLAVDRAADAVSSCENAFERGGGRLALATLANALRAADHDEAAVERLREALLTPDPPQGYSYADWSLHFQLGVVLHSLHRLDEAEQAYARSVEGRPNYAEAWCNRGLILLELDRADEALTCLRRGHELGAMRGASWRYPSADWVRTAEQAVAGK